MHENIENVAHYKKKCHSKINYKEIIQLLSKCISPFSQKYTYIEYIQHLAEFSLESPDKRRIFLKDLSARTSYAN